MSTLQLKILVFVSGATVMAVEMTALRLLAPFFGTSLLITTILIGSMMGFLSLGYWLGGKYGDKHPTLPALAKVTAAASVLVLAIPFLGQPILRGASAAMRPLLQGEALSEPTVAFAMIVGVLVGTYSSIYVASPLLLLLTPRKERKAS